MDKENLVEAFILKCLFTCYFDNEHYCNCYLKLNIIQKWTLQSYRSNLKTILLNIFYDLEST